MKNPCRGCQRRNVTCHAICADYAIWKDEKDKIAEKIKAARDEYNTYYKPALARETRRNKKG